MVGVGTHELHPFHRAKEISIWCQQYQKVTIDKDGRYVVVHDRSVVALLLLPVPKAVKLMRVDLAIVTAGVASSSNRLVVKVF